MSNKKHQILLIFVLTAGLLYNSQATGSRICTWLLSQGVGFLDSQYATVASEPDPVKKSQSVNRLLNNAFFPLILELRDLTQNHAKVQSITESLNANLRPLPAQYGPNSDTRQPELNYNTLQVSPTIHSYERDKIQGKIDYNAGNGVLLYGLSSRGSKRIFSPLSQRKEFVPVDADPIFGRVDRAYWVEISDQLLKDYGDDMLVLGASITPVGYYGEDFAKKLLMTAQILTSLASQNLTDESQTVMDSDPHLIREETARGRDSYGLVRGKTPLYAVIEGILSYHQFVTAMLGDKVLGYESGSQALHDLTFNGAGKLGLVSEFTARLPMGMIGPMNLTGSYFKNPLIQNQDGKLEFSEELKATLKRLSDHRLEQRGHRGVCPMASILFKLRQGLPQPDVERKTGLQHLAEAYWQIFQSLN